MKKLVAVFCLMSLSLSAQASQKVLCSVNDNDAVELSWPDGYANFPTEQSIGVFGGRDVRIQLFMGQRHSKGPWEEMIHISAEDGQQGDISKPGHIMASFGPSGYVLAISYPLLLSSFYAWFAWALIHGRTGRSR